MEGRSDKDSPEVPSAQGVAVISKRNRALRWVIPLVLVVISGGAGYRLASTANAVQGELIAAVQLIPQLEEAITAKDTSLTATVAELKAHTARARTGADDPLWKLAALLPWIGPNLQAVTDVAVSADDIARLGVDPLVSTFQSLDWKTLVPDQDGADLGPLARANPTLQGAAHAVSSSSERLNRIEASALLPQVRVPLMEARTRLGEISASLDRATSAASIMPAMLGADSPRSYLLIVQNNAEPRASGGIPGALAALQVDKGRLTLGAQSSASALGTITPAVQVDPAQEEIYSGRLGKFMQDVNLTPDFPTAASTASVMWEIHTGQKTDGVVSVDPVALSYLLDATGSVNVVSPGSSRLPAELTSKNVVETLLSTVYTEIPEPEAQDAYFAVVAKQIFDAFGHGHADPNHLLEALTRGVNEGRVSVWSSAVDEQSVIEKHKVGGAISGPSVHPSQFGVYFNDGTGAKMDYYVKRTVQLIEECPRGGYEQSTLRITSTNTAPLDAATSLPRYVTGGGAFGVPAGSVQTNIAAYGPVQAVVETAKFDGQHVGFAPYLHANRPVGVVAIQLAPGETRIVDLTFGKIVQHNEPDIVVTPTVQDVNDVLLPNQLAPCG